MLWVCAVVADREHAYRLTAMSEVVLTFLHDLECPKWCSLGNSKIRTSCQSVTYHHIKLSYACEPYIQQANNSHLRKIIAQCRTGSHWLHIETGRYKKLAKQDRTCPMCFFKLTSPGVAPECWDDFDSDDESSGRIEDEHHAIFDCSGYTCARELFQDFSQSHITSISQILNQPQCNRLAKFLIWIRMMRMNKAWASLMGLHQAPNRLWFKQSIKKTIDM